MKDLKIELTVSPGAVSVDIDHKRYEITTNHVAVDGRILAYKQEGYEVVYDTTVDSIIEEIKTEIDGLNEGLALALKVIRNPPPP